MKVNKNYILEYVKQKSEGLKILKESEAFEVLKKKIRDFKETFIDTFESRFESALTKEEKAKKDEDFILLKESKTELKDAAEGLYKSYSEIASYYKEIAQEAAMELKGIEDKGASVFKNKVMIEFVNLDFKRGETLKINSASSETIVKKANDNNSYEIIKTNIGGLKPGDYLTLPDMKIGGEAVVSAYRVINGRGEEIKRFRINNIKGLYKNPS